jgi:hypothetical protein
VAQGTQLVRDEERQLLAISEAYLLRACCCRSIITIPNALLHPAYMRIVDKFRAIRMSATENGLQSGRIVKRCETLGPSEQHG